MTKNDYSAPKATTLNGSIEGNDAQVSQEASLTVGERLTNLEERFRQTEQRQEELEWDIRFVKDELGSRLVGLEDNFKNLKVSTIKNIERLSQLDTLFTGLQGSVIHFEKRIDQFEKRIVKIEDDIMYLRPLSETPGVTEYRKIKEMEEQLNKQDQHFDRRCTEIEGRLSSEGADKPVAPNIDQFSLFSKELMGSVQRELQAIKTALAAFSKHIHLPDGRLGMPFTLKG